MAKKENPESGEKQPTWATGYQLAKMVGVSPQRIYALKKQGRIKESKRGFHVPSCTKTIFEAREMNGKHLPVDKKFATLTDARTAHETQKAKLAELEYRKRAGELVEREDMIKFCSEIITVTRARLLGIGSKVAPNITGLESIKKIKAIIDAEIHEALTELSKMK